jgi:hypothetical protein
MKIIGLSGFGDSIYIEPLVRNEAEKESIELYTKFPDVFAHLKNVKCLPFNRAAKVDKTFSYLDGKPDKNTTQIQDLGYSRPEQFKLDYKPICVLAAGYEGMLTRNEFTPNKEVMQQIINDLKAAGFEILHITNKAIDKYEGVTEIESQNYFQTVCMFQGADLIVCQQGWGVALAEGLNKDCLVVFADKIRKSNLEFIRQITPKKVICKNTTRFVWDNEFKGLDDVFKRKSG